MIMLVGQERADLVPPINKKKDIKSNEKYDVNNRNFMIGERNIR